MRSLGPGFLAAAVLLCGSFARADEFPVQQWEAWNRQGAGCWPGKTWSRYATPEEAGWSSDKLEEARAEAERIGSAAVLVVYDGAVVAQWGPIERRYLCHSIRKSLLSALYGIHVARGEIDLQKTLAELGIDDQPPLSDQEKQAKVIDLLTAHSGVYHTAAYETARMKDQRPPRDSHRPGEFFWYNNWDFNALGTIFERQTHRKLFEDFRRELAEPLAMEDFRMEDTYYHLERQHSIHPAYPFRMSARDLARLGLLYLRGGRWGDRRILSEEWIARSTASYFRPGDSTRTPEYAYGYLWWPIVQGPLAPLGMYSARGVGGHSIDVIPGAKVVIVHRVDTYWDLGDGLGKRPQHRVDDPDRLGLIQQVLRARVAPPKSSPRLVPIENPPRPATVRLSEEVLDRYVGLYEVGSTKLRVRRGAGGLLIGRASMGDYHLLARSPTEFFMEDLDTPVVFTLDEHGRPRAISVESVPGKPVEGRPASAKKAA